MSMVEAIKNRVARSPRSQWLAVNEVHEGDSKELLKRVEPSSVALSVWSPPYFVGKSYERHMSYEDWERMLQEVIALHVPALKPGAFMAVNIADILCFPDSALPRVQAENLSGNRLSITREEIQSYLRKNPELNRYQLAERLGVSEQTIDRRLKNNNVRGGKHATQTRVKLVGHLLEEFAYQAGLYLYDRRVWVKDPCWENSKWHTNSYRAVDEFEYVYIFWKPGITTVDRARLGKKEWVEWGSRAVWRFPSVRSNDDHEAKFPAELPRRLIRMFTRDGDIVLDPFMGSGTSAIVALEQGRRYIGLELMPKYAALARGAIERATRATRRESLFPARPA